MVIKPMVRNNICLNSHPAGCVRAVHKQVEYVKKAFQGVKQEGAPRLALVLGSSTGYGLASRVALSFGYRTATVGVSFEKEGSAAKPGTPGFYNNLAFEREAKAAGVPYKTLNMDAFSNEAKNEVIKTVKELAKSAGVAAKIDLVVYSLASPVRTDPKSGTMYRSVIKPIGAPYSGSTVDMLTSQINTVSVNEAQEAEITATVKVMGGEDWEEWIKALDAAKLLKDNYRTVAYTYIGPELSWAIYKNGTIGRAKEDLERACRDMNKRAGRLAAFVSVNKAVVTRASAVIPIIPLYISCLFRVMKDKKLHEGCIEQMCRLFLERLYCGAAATDASKVPVDGQGRIRLDDREMREDVQKETTAKMAKITNENINAESDLAGFKHDFLEAHGFDVEGVDYEADVAAADKI